MAIMVAMASSGLSRRHLLAAGTVSAAGLLAGRSLPATSAPKGIDEPDGVVDAHGEHQAGIVRPLIAQRHCGVVVCDLPRPDVRGLLATLGSRIHALTLGGHPALGGLPP